MECPPFLKEHQDGVSLDIHLVPGAKSSEIIGVHGDRLKIALQAPPVDGKANKALCLYLAGVFSLKKSNVELIRGKQSRMKTVFLHQLGLEQAYQLLHPFCV